MQKFGMFYIQRLMSELSPPESLTMATGFEHIRAMVIGVDIDVAALVEIC